MRCVASKEVIASTVKHLGVQIFKDHCKDDVPITLVPIANGSVFFAPDLIRAIGLDLRIEIIKARSYRGIVPEAARVCVEAIEDSRIRGQNILIVDDILDTGATVNAVIAHLKERGAGNIELCTLLIKEGKQVFPIAPTYCGLIVDEDTWVVGYGMDLNDEYRTQSYIGVPKETIRPGQVLKNARPWTGGGVIPHASHSIRSGMSSTLSVLKNTPVPLK
jgi:hypoxanthine phosphoribosyltransferase